MKTTGIMKVKQITCCCSTGRLGKSSLNREHLNKSPGKTKEKAPQSFEEGTCQTELGVRAGASVAQLASTMMGRRKKPW